jgi:decaprenylphospho-beta-D-erythro-pentofuranosid-2-ulose 2-reductase
VRVGTVLPGFIQTKISNHLDLPEKLTARSEEVAEDIIQASQWIILTTRNIPEKIFKRIVF